MLVKTLIVLVFVVITICVGLYFRKRTASVSDFVLGGRNVGAWLSAFAYGTAYFSAVIFVGYAGQFGWKFGIAGTWIGVGNALIGSLLAWLLLARRTRIMSHHLSSTTMPDFFGKRYDSKNLKIAASMIVFVFLIPYTASLYNGLSRIFGMAFNIDYSICVIIMAVLTGIYVVAGGYMATAVNDFIQGIIMFGGIVAVIVAVLNGHGGFTAAIQKLTAVQDVAVSTQPGVFTSIFGPQPLNLLGVVILTSMGTWGMPQLVHKFYAIKDDKAVRRGTVISTVFALIIAGGCYFLGGFGRLYTAQVDVKALDTIIPTMLQTLPDLLIGIVVILVLSASMSTLSSLVLTSSSTLTLDFLKGSVVKKMDEKRQVFIMRIFIMIFIAVSVVIALVQYTSKITFIAQLMGISWGAVAGSFLAPFLYGLYWKKVTKTAVWTSFIVGVGLTVSNMFLNYFDSPINAGAITMIATLILVPIVSLVTPKMKAEKVNETFACLETKK